MESDYDSCLVFTTKSTSSYIAGIFVLLFGLGCFWLAMLRPGEENGWVPWVVGGFFASLGLFTLFSRSRVVFDPASKKWLDTWEILFFKFSDAGSFDQLNKIQIEESEGRHGSATIYIWVIGSGDIKIAVDIANDLAEATSIAEQLQSVLDLPIKTMRT